MKKLIEQVIHNAFNIMFEETVNSFNVEEDNEIKQVIFSIGQAKLEYIIARQYVEEALKKSSQLEKEIKNANKKGSL